MQIFNGDEEGPNGPAIDINTTGPVTLPASFEYLGQTYNVKEIGRNAFYQCKGITSVVIPEGVTKVAKWAFLLCNALESVTLPTTLTEIGDFAFRECKLSSVELPENLIALGQQAFCKNENLTTITLPASLTDIGSDVFSNTNLLSVIALGINPAPLQNESAFWPDQTKLNPVILTVPYGTRQRYLDAGYTESTETTIGAVYKIVEQPVEKNHTFLQVGEGAEIYLEYYDAIGNRQDRQLTPGNTFSAYITNNNIQAANSEEEIAHNLQVFLTPGYTLTKLLRNGRDVTDLYQTYYGTEDGTTAIKFELKDVDINAYQKLSMDDNDVTWMICIEDEESTKPVNPYDANGDGSITIADVTKLVNIILGKDHSYEPQDIELEYDVRMKPSNTYGEIEVPIAQAICDAFALSAAEIAEKTCSSIPPTPERGEIGLYWYNPNEARRIISYTANTGYWFNASGTPCSWSDSGALVAAEFNKTKGCFVLSQYPNKNQAGDAREMRIMFLYHNDFDKYAVVGITFHVTFSDDADNTATLR